MAHKHKSNDCVSLDLFVGDEDDEPGSSQNVVETLCLRILSKSNIKYKFGGLQIHVRSPDFHVGKSFHVNLDENNRIDSIESYREPEESYLFGRRRVSLLSSNNIYNTQPARILITPKKQPESEATNNLPNPTNNSSNVQASNQQTPNDASNNQANGNLVGKVNQTNLNKNKQIPILTADVVVEEILDKDKDKDNKENVEDKNQEKGQSLGQTLVNAFLNKKPNNHSNASSMNNSPSQSIHSINSLSSSMLELRSSSPLNPTSPEKLISKLNLQAYAQSDNRYIKHKSKKYDFKKKSKEKLIKNGDKNGNRKSDEKINAEKIDPTKLDPNSATKKQQQTEPANDKKTDDKHEKVQTKDIGVCTTNSFGSFNLCANFDASNLSLSSLTIPQGFFFSLRRTRSWKK